MALGADGHRIYLVPSLDLVVARQLDPNAPRTGADLLVFDPQLWQLITASAPR